MCVQVQGMEMPELHRKEGEKLLSKGEEVRGVEVEVTNWKPPGRAGLGAACPGKAASAVPTSVLFLVGRRCWRTRTAPHRFLQRRL